MIRCRSLPMIGLLFASQLAIAAADESASDGAASAMTTRVESRVGADAGSSSETRAGVDLETRLGSGSASSLGAGLGPAQNYLLQSMLILGGLLVLLMGALKLLRKSGHLKTHSGQRLQVVEAVSLGGSDRAVLVRVGGEELLLGVSQGRVAPLMMVNPDKHRDQGDGDSELTGSVLQPPTLTGGFSQLLNRLRS